MINQDCSSLWGIAGSLSLEAFTPKLGVSETPRADELVHGGSSSEPKGTCLHSLSRDYFPYDPGELGPLCV